MPTNTVNAALHDGQCKQMIAGKARCVCYGAMTQSAQHAAPPDRDQAIIEPTPQMHNLGDCYVAYQRGGKGVWTARWAQVLARSFCHHLPKLGKPCSICVEAYVEASAGESYSINHLS